MPKRKKLTAVPSYRAHPNKPNTAQAVWKDRDDKPRRRELPGAFNSPESHTALESLRAEVKASATGNPPKRRPVSLAALFDAYLKYARGHYRRPDGSPTATVSHINTTAKALCAEYAQKPADKFGPLDLKNAVRKWERERLTRSQCNRRLNMTKAAFKWAASEQMVPADVWLALTSVSGPKKGRTTATETEPVGPVSAKRVNATLPYLNRYVRAMVRVQWYTGMRPGEVCMMRPCDIDRTGEVWLYRPEHHKTEHKGKSRAIPIGPKAQEVLKKFCLDGADGDFYIFPPQEAVAEVWDDWAQRWNPEGHAGGKRRNHARTRRRWPNPHYDRTSYTRAVARACAIAFPAPEPLERESGESIAEHKARLSDEETELLKAWRDEHRWSPNQLRHSFATRVRHKHGLEAAQVLLGHEQADVTQIYAERNLALAVSIAKEEG